MPPASCWSCCPDGGVAASAHDCASRQVRPVATRDLSTVLALEITPTGSPANTHRTPAAHRRHGGGESHSGHRDSGSCTGTSPYIPQLNGRFNSFETASLLRRLSRARARSRWDLRARRRRGGAFDVAARAEDAGRIAGRTVPPGDADWPPVSPAHRVVAMSGSVGYVTITGLKASLREFLRSTGTSVVARRVVLDTRFSEGAIRLPTGRL